MNFIKKPLVFLAFALFLMPSHSFAQYQFNLDPFGSYFKNLKRYELGFTADLPTGNINGVTRVTAPFIGDTTNLKRTLTGMGFGMSIGVTAPFKRTGHISCWAMDVQLLLHYYTWSNLNQVYGIDGSFTNAAEPLSATSYEAALPLGIQYMVGNDAAVLTKRLPFCASFGIGVIPQMYMTNLNEVSTYDNQFAFGVTPYAKIEGGVFLGWCIKLRLMYTYGQVNLFDANNAIPSKIGSTVPMTDGPFGFSTTSHFMASLILMPFSGKWAETKWYNTYDTYNQHDRLN